MVTRRAEILQRLRRSFPQPVSDPEHDAYFVFTFLKTLTDVDALKSQAPMLGSPCDPDWQAALEMRLADVGLPLEQVARELVKHLEGMFIWGHPRSQINVITTPSIAGILGVLLPAIYNPNLCSEESSRRIAQAEVEVGSMTAALVGYDPAKSGGLFTFGGTGALLYGVKLGLEKAYPGCFEHGVTGPAAVLCSDRSHYACLNAASWLGLGRQAVRKAATGPDNSVRLEALEEVARRTLREGRRIAAFVATVGTTDAFGIDSVAGVVALRDRLVQEFSLDYVPHVHADAVIGWAWSVFDDYDYVRNPLGFRGRTVRALAAATHRIRHLHRADSIGIDFHKTAYVPYVSSMILVKDRTDWESIARTKEQMPYLFQSGQYHPGMFSLETTRSGCGPLAALANLLLFGREGLQVLLGHAVEMAEVLRESLEAHPNLTVLNRENVGPVTLFRAYPPGTDTFTVKDREQHDPEFAAETARCNDYNRKIFERVHAEALAGRGVVLSLTDCYRETDYGLPIVALKSYILSPFAEECQADEVIRQVLAAQAAIDAAE